MKIENQDPIQNHQEFKQMMGNMLNAFPGYYQTIHDWIIENGKVVIRWTIPEMRKGKFISIPPLVNRLKRQGLIPFYKITAYLIYSRIILSSWQKLFLRQQAQERRRLNIYLLGGIIAVLLVVVMVIVIVVAKLRSAQRREALEQNLEYQPGLALVRYVMLNRQCSEETAYQRIAMFVKNQVPLDGHSSIDRMLAYDRQSLLDSARNLLVHNPDAIDKI